MTRAYVQGPRAEAVEERRRRIVDAMFELMATVPYDEATLREVAELAGVSLKTVTRQFGSKDALMAACMEVGPERERARRPVSPGDVRGVVSTLCRRYEEIAAIHLRHKTLEDRLPLAGQAFAQARRAHLAWLAEAFAPWLPEDAVVREHRLMALFAATEIDVYWTLRSRLAQTGEQAAAVMFTTLTALVAAWET